MSCEDRHEGISSIQGNNVSCSLCAELERMEDEINTLIEYGTTEQE